jgi:hypothetical protein
MSGRVLPRLVTNFLTVLSQQLEGFDTVAASTMPLRPKSRAGALA